MGYFASRVVGIAGWGPESAGGVDEGVDDLGRAQRARIAKVKDLETAIGSYIDGGGAARAPARVAEGRQKRQPDLEEGHPVRRHADQCLIWSLAPSDGRLVSRPVAAPAIMGLAAVHRLDRRATGGFVRRQG
jgi:hypothetical protein